MGQKTKSDPWVKNGVTIRLQASGDYGRIRFYPQCPLSEAICKIAGKTTLNEKDLDVIHLAGCTIDYGYRGIS